MVTVRVKLANKFSILNAIFIKFFYEYLFYSKLQKSSKSLQKEWGSIEIVDFYIVFYIHYFKFEIGFV